MEDLRYPAGRFRWPDSVTEEDRARWIGDIAATPGRLRSALDGLSAPQLAAHYRTGGWTVTQLVHHLADSHMNSYVRFRLALTEQNPVIKPYDEAAWAELADRNAPVELSLCLLDCLHQRWVILLRSLTPEDWNKSFVHPELGPVTLQNNLALYAWHGAHHIAHITALRKRENW